MKTLARFTAVIFIVIGLSAVVAGFFMISRGGIQPTPVVPSIFGVPDLESLMLPLRFMVGGTLSLQGLMLAAVGEGLWLVASLVDHAKKAREHLATLEGRGTFTIP